MLYENRVPNYDERARIADAFAHFSSAVAADHPEAFYLAALHEYGAHAPQNFSRALELYARGCGHVAVSAKNRQLIAC